VFIKLGKDIQEVEIPKKLPQTGVLYAIHLTSFEIRKFDVTSTTRYLSFYGKNAKILLLNLKKLYSFTQNQIKDEIKQQIINRPKKEEQKLLEILSKKVLKFMFEENRPPSRIEMFQKLDIPLKYLDPLWEYIIAPYKEEIEKADIESLERNGKRILNYIMNAKIHIFKKRDWNPSLAEITVKLNISIEDSKKAFKYLNLHPDKHFPETPDNIESKTKVIGGYLLEQKYLTLMELVNQGFRIAEAKIAYVLALETAKGHKKLSEEQLDTLFKQLGILKLQVPTREEIEQSERYIEGLSPEIPDVRELRKNLLLIQDQYIINFYCSPNDVYELLKGIISKFHIFRLLEDEILTCNLKTGEWNAKCLFYSTNKESELEQTIEISIQGNIHDKEGQCEIFLNSNEIKDSFNQKFIQSIEIKIESLNEFQKELEVDALKNVINELPTQTIELEDLVKKTEYSRKRVILIMGVLELREIVARDKEKPEEIWHKNSS
jgi:hypothetical protein